MHTPVHLCYCVAASALIAVPEIVIKAVTPALSRRCITTGHGELQVNSDSVAVSGIAFHLEHGLRNLQLPPCRASTVISTNSRSSTP
ncbi:hypothetical protein CDAR_74411 [Caerostris darwini]|uniref:Secreted protein n=1 Tax=Caerostris darwini TaxID=1538125 RepID=A0AAV4UJX8_9ARAC|nr:hypothetical protein CDAR_74411 [Caerostris darwini]